MTVIERYHPAKLSALCSRVSTILRHGGVVAIPTETYYGLGADPFNPTAVTHLAKVKGRADGKPILLLIGAREQLSDLVDHVPPAATALMEAFWPGPLTIVFQARAGVHELITAGTGTVGVRWTSLAALADILQRVGPVTGTSANRSGETPARTAQEVQQALGNEIDLIIDAGTMPGGFPSTVIQVQGQTQIMREGAITRASIQQALRARGFFLNEGQM
jgi:L-threonylcarbamoyladenylate synthase